jgi:hypothetical protein
MPPTFLSVFARVHPAVFDAIFPHGPAIRDRGDRVSLNPQPLPPAEALQTAAAQMANELVRLAVETEVRGGTAEGFVNELIDDWCGTPWPRKWPWPIPGPRPAEGLAVEAFDVGAARAVGALVFASVGSRLAEGALAKAFSEGSERLAQAAVTT